VIYLYWYFGIGIATLAVVFGALRLAKQADSGTLAELLKAMDTEPKKLSDRLLNNVVAPVLGTSLIFAVWPFVVYLVVNEWFKNKDADGMGEDPEVTFQRWLQQSKSLPPAEIKKEPEFAVQRQHLLEHLTVPEVERRELVFDPLHAVPDRPFGHLNAAWQEFLKGKADGAELWSFSAPWQTTWGRKEQRRGYVVVQDDVPGAYFLTVWKILPDDA